MKRGAYILLCLLASVPLWGQADYAGMARAETVADTVNRDAEDFVIASLLVADPGTVLYSVLGHACIRMQCPAYGLDYCFSYESEAVEHRVADFLAGRLYMGLFAIPVEKYCAPYREEGRGVYEYIFNLPVEVKRELWRILDEEMMKGSMQPYDYYHRGCAISCVRFIEQAMDDSGISINYPTGLYNEPKSAKEIFVAHTRENSWNRFILYFITGSEAEKMLVGGQQLLVPADLVCAWQQATCNGVPVLQQERHTLVAGTPQYPQTKFTPMMLAILLLLIAIANLFWKKPYIDWCFLALQTAVGLCMTYLIFISDLCCTSWNWLIIPFNPLPAVFWHWRRYWALPYALLIAVWCIVMTIAHLYFHLLCDWIHIVLVLSIIMLLAKQHVTHSLNLQTQPYNSL
ncbi:MAG: DUF4105 domain-containing protein [Paludibacteraceae bacterium]